MANKLAMQLDKAIQILKGIEFTLGSANIMKEPLQTVLTALESSERHITMINYNKPLMARIHDFDSAYITEEEAKNSYIVRQVEKIELPCKQHNNTIIWYNGGLRSECFDLIEQDSAICRVCGCTDNMACENGCWWVEEDLCSECVEMESEADA